jgi:hypothetical protein
MVTVFQFAIVVIIEVLVLVLIKTLYKESQQPRREKRFKRNSW